MSLSFGFLSAGRPNGSETTDRNAFADRMLNPKQSIDVAEVS